MKTNANTLDRIARCAVDRLCTEGVGSLTVGSVAKAADVSTALVHYHFATKQRLLAAAAGRLAAGRTERRCAPFAGSGMAALDAAWSALADEVRSGAERAWHDVTHLGGNDPAVRDATARQHSDELKLLAERLPPLLRSLGARARTPEELAAVVSAMLDGLALRLAGGGAEAGVRSAFDAFWLVLIASAQTGRS